jgi:hypothetical protein
MEEITESLGTLPLLPVKVMEVVTCAAAHTVLPALYVTVTESMAESAVSALVKALVVAS